MKDVDHHFEIIEHDPLTRWKAVDRSRSQPVIFFQSCFDLVRDRLELRLRCGRTNHEVIGKAGDPGKIENNDVFSLFV